MMTTIYVSMLAILLNFFIFIEEYQFEGVVRRFQIAFKGLLSYFVIPERLRISEEIEPCKCIGKIHSESFPMNVSPFRSLKTQNSYENCELLHLHLIFSPKSSDAYLSQFIYFFYHFPFPHPCLLLFLLF